jgi:AcrR family transcriptional regulator
MLLAADSGGHLNHRSIWVLKAVGGEPGLSNKDVAERVGGMGKGHVSVVLGRLRHIGLIENTQDDPTPYVPNAWRLTAAGEQLERALPHETLPADGMRGARRKLADRARTGGRSRGVVVGASEVGGSEGAPAPVDARRARIVAATARLICRGGVRDASVERIASAARVTETALLEGFADVDAVVMAAFEWALAQARERAGTAFEAEEGWLEAVRSSVRALLELFDEQPLVAQLLLIHSAEAGLLLRARRGDVLERLAAVLDEERAPARRYPPSLAAESVVSGVLGVVHGRLSRSDPGPLLELCNQLMSFIVQPYLGARAARRELLRPAEAPAVSLSRDAALKLLQGTSGRALKRHLTPQVLAIIAAEPGLSNIEVAQRASVKDQGHMSRLLARLVRLGLVEKRMADGGRVSSTNAWVLTGTGEEIELALRSGVSVSNGRRKKTSNAVYETATALAHLLRSLGRNGNLRRERARFRAHEHLALLAAFVLRLLHCVRREAPRALLDAVAPSSPQLNKRCQAPYSISSSRVKPEPLRALVWQVGEGHKHRYCLPFLPRTRAISASCRRAEVCRPARRDTNSRLGQPRR